MIVLMILKHFFINHIIYTLLLLATFAEHYVFRVLLHSSLSLLHRIPLCEYTKMLCIHSTAEGHWVVFSWLFQIVLIWVFGNMLLLSIHPVGCTPGSGTAGTWCIHISTWVETGSNSCSNQQCRRISSCFPSSLCLGVSFFFFLLYVMRYHCDFDWGFWNLNYFLP